ncbi:hypothetical protein [Bradyrhizobium sp. CCGB01]|uniref:hypothetical protein n=1 Tax=Bradyrhizobium sp. CCGB01 TaxID=2949634 RepID=UPI0020B32B98|nr:hypothetical protein [Bradyrhizobium sp. CCGB01]MCP3411330.1 hypothetical protein [Bradyrhizobium sp. CCGB01]
MIRGCISAATSTSDDERISRPTFDDMFDWVGARQESLRRRLRIELLVCDPDAVVMLVKLLLSLIANSLLGFSYLLGAEHTWWALLIALPQTQ